MDRERLSGYLSGRMCSCPYGPAELEKHSTNAALGMLRRPPVGCFSHARARNERRGLSPRSAPTAASYGPGCSAAEPGFFTPPGRIPAFAPQGPFCGRAKRSHEPMASNLCDKCLAAMCQSDTPNALGAYAALDLQMRAIRSRGRVGSCSSTSKITRPSRTATYRPAGRMPGVVTSSTRKSLASTIVPPSARWDCLT